MATWTTPEALVEWMGLPTTVAANAAIEDALDSAENYQRAHFDPVPLAEAIVDPNNADADLVLATHMRASALYKRRQTPDGISSVGDFAVMRVSSSDPDIRRLESRFWLDGFA